MAIKDRVVAVQDREIRHNWVAKNRWLTWINYSYLFWRFRVACPLVLRTRYTLGWGNNVVDREIIYTHVLYKIHILYNINIIHCTIMLNPPRLIIVSMFINIIIGVPRGEWATPGGTAIPGQPVGWGKQASHSTPHHKNWDNSVRPLGPNISY